MSTRGLFGIRKNGIDKAEYNHSDSYPEGLGKKFIRFVSEYHEKLPEYFKKIQVIDAKTQPTKEQIDYCIKMGWYDQSVSERSTNDWYCLLRNTQSLKAWGNCIDKGQMMFLDNQINFIKDSSFCEYAYIYDVDSQALEFYRGFQNSPDPDNRYGTKVDNGCYPCKLVGAYGLKEIKDNPDLIIENMCSLSKSITPD